MRLRIPEPVSAGIILSYRCSGECRHCMYACSPGWREEWLPEGRLGRMLEGLRGRLVGAPGGGIGINYGLHLTGGEPFLNFGLLLRAVRRAAGMGLPSTFVETNSFWCTDEETTRERLLQLREAGLRGLLVSVNPFVVEHVPFERVERAVRVGSEVFGENVLVYQPFFYHLFKRLGLRGTLSFERYLELFGSRSLLHAELLPMGRAVYRLEGVLGELYGRRRAEDFFGESCLRELTRPWHVHLDCLGNYVAGYCGGLSLGEAEDLEGILSGVDLEERPVLGALVRDLRLLYELAVELGYREREGGYVSKCHLCLDLRRHLAETGQFRELSPREFYEHL